MSFFENTRKPVGLGGKIMVAMMNFGHSAMAEWGLSFLQPAPDVKFRNSIFREGNRKHGARNRNVLQNVLFLKTFRIKNPAENVVQVCGSLHILAMNKMRVDPECVHLAGVANQGLNLSLWQRFCQ